MLRATRVESRGNWDETKVVDRVVLDFEDRFRRRVRLRAESGLLFLLDLATATVLGDGDGLALDGGGFVRVVAKPERLVAVTAATPGGLARLAWHIGNRHLPADIGADRILIRDDHVIVDMLRGLGATVEPVEAPFNPEGGAYGQHNHDPRHPHGHDHGHDHGDDHGHDHAHDGHGHSHGHAHTRARSAG
ncbi:urease accessory protein UreE [Stella sp.]|uniref:urease accessory protein UreE n=1 Tax=Stella sp. TaxID=2912054 RepID=UPI0035B0D662